MHQITAIETTRPGGKPVQENANANQESKCLNQSMADDRSKYLRIFEQMQDPVLLLNSDGKVDNCNRAWIKIFENVAVPGTRYDDDGLRKVLPWLGKAMLTSIAEQGHERSFETRIDTPQGGIPFQVHLQLLYDANDVICGTAITLIDISERKQEEMAVCEKEKLQGVLEMAGAVCHEMNQPLMAISGYSELLSMNHSGDQALDELILKIKNQVYRLGEITHKLMGITKYETKDHLESRIIDIDKATEK